MDEKLKEQLDALQKGLEGKTEAEVKKAVASFEASVKEDVQSQVKSVKEAFEAELKEIKEGMIEAAKKHADELAEVQKHADALDVKMQSKAKSEVKGQSFNEVIKTSIKDNFESVSTVRKGNSVKIDIKAVGDMTLGNNLTGDQPRDYSNSVIAVPSPLINFVDLIGAPINISGGTYTFPQEVGSEGAIAFQTEGSAKSKIDYDLKMVDVTTDFLAGTTTYSKKMANNLPFLESFIPRALRRDYIKQENEEFYTVLAAGALASAQTSDTQNEIEMLMQEIATLEQLDNPVNGIVVRPSDWWKIQATDKSSSGYGLPGVVTYTNGTLYINGIPVYKATWIPENKYLVGDWTMIKKVVTEGLSLEFSNENKDNFEKNNITARIESQIGLAIERDTAVILGDFTATGV